MAQTIQETVRRAWEAIDYRAPLVARALGEAGVFRELAKGPKTTKDLAGECGLHDVALERALALLVNRDVVELDVAGCWKLTDVGQMLIPGHPSGAGDMAVFLPWELQGWSRLDYSLETGRSGFELVAGSPIFDWFQANPEAGRRLDAFMQQRTTGLLRRSVAGYDRWPEDGVVVDVGGGNGALLAFLLASRPNVRGVLLDLPGVVAGAHDVLEAAGVADRVEVVAGDFFAAVPSGGDVYVMASVLHDWDDERAGRILDAVRAAITPRKGCLLLYEAALRPVGEPDPMRATDLHMLVMAGGRERRSDEWRGLLGDHGFSVTRIVPTDALSWIEASPDGRAD
jgi:hypothetical protein